MDEDLWAARLSLANALQQPWDEASDDDGVCAEFTCPYCDEDYDIVTLCSHMEEEHLFEPKGAVCPVCAAKVPQDMVAHIILQHGHLFKLQRRHRLMTVGVPPAATLFKEYGEMLLQALRISDGSLTNTTDLLSALAYSFPMFESEELVMQNEYIDGEAPNMSSTKHQNTRLDVYLSVEEREQKMKQESLRASFVQQLLLSTFTEDS